MNDSLDTLVIYENLMSMNLIKTIHISMSTCYHALCSHWCQLLWKELRKYLTIILNITHKQRNTRS